jgi:hypothetical protein
LNPLPRTCFWFRYQKIFYALRSLIS